LVLSLTALAAALPPAPRATIPALPSPDAPLFRAEEPDREYRLPPNELVPSTVAVQAEAGDVADWGHATIGVSDAWKQTKGRGVKVAVLDTGCDSGHRDLKAQIVASKDFTGSRSGSADVNGHGSHCAGIVLAAENAVGMVGVAPEAQLIVGKVLGDNGSGLSTWIAAGIDWAVEQGADVISMSLGSPSEDSRIRAAIDRARTKGVIVVGAAGNEGPREGTVGYPGGTPGVVCVAAIDDRLATANFSSRGKQVQVAAPGVNIRSCYPGDRFATMSGTSMATPYAAGCAALYVAHCKAKALKWSPDDFAQRIANTSKDLPPSGRDTATGFGLIQPALLLPAADVPVPDPKDPSVPAPIGDRIELTLPGLTIDGRAVKRIVIELAPKP
jgi:subtilisin family serine protease